MRAAELGDDVHGDDPTVRRLEALSARITGHEASLFVPSGTMGNEIAVRCHTRPGDRIVLAAHSHIVHHESGGPAAISGVLVESIPAERGILDPERVAPVLRPPDIHDAPATLLCVENTSNLGGGSVYPIERVDSLLSLARRAGLATHLDGARLFNAQVASGLPAARYAQGFDSATFCLSKGLGCPVGSVLCGPSRWIESARRVRKMLGGGMRQVGLLAAAGIYALENNVPLLARDHARARALYQELRAQGWQVQEPETNMLYLQAPQAPALACALKDQGLLCFAVGPEHLRLVAHLDIDDLKLERAISIFRELASTRRAQVSG